MADVKSEWLRLPGSWAHGVTQDGRVFFIDEEAERTTWIHPATGEAVISGHRKTPDLPTGWEEGYTFEGARHYIKCCLTCGVFPAFSGFISYFLLLLYCFDFHF
ncbi:pleckstrin homology domain-containing family A member 5 isoform X17 [Rhinoraja longicauda]